MYVERNHFIHGLYSFDIDAATAKKEITDKKIYARHTKQNVCMVIMSFAIVLATLLFVGGVTWTLVEMFMNNFDMSLKTIGIRAMCFIVVPIILGVIGSICEAIYENISQKSDESFYTNAEKYLITQEVDIITSFIVYDEYKADLYLQYKVYYEDDDEKITETTDVEIIKGFKVKRTNKIDEPVLDVNNNIYYVPYGYVNKPIVYSTSLTDSFEKNK